MDTAFEVMSFGLYHSMNCYYHYYFSLIFYLFHLLETATHVFCQRVRKYCWSTARWRSQIHRLIFLLIRFSRSHPHNTLTISPKRKSNQYVINTLFRYVYSTEMKRPLTIVGYLDYWLTLCVFFLHVFHVWFLFCLYVGAFSTLLSVASTNFASKRT